MGGVTHLPGAAGRTGMHAREPARSRAESHQQRRSASIQCSCHPHSPPTHPPARRRRPGRPAAPPVCPPGRGGRGRRPPAAPPATPCRAPAAALRGRQGVGEAMRSAGLQHLCCCQAGRMLPYAGRAGLPLVKATDAAHSSSQPAHPLSPRFAGAPASGWPPPPPAPPPQAPPPAPSPCAAAAPQASPPWRPAQRPCATGRPIGRLQRGRCKCGMVVRSKRHRSLVRQH